MNDFARRASKLVNINVRAEIPNECAINFVNVSITLDEKLVGLSEREAIDVLVSERCGEKSPFSLGVLWHIMTNNNPEAFTKFVRYIHGAGLDYWNLILCATNMAIIELWHQLHESCKDQVLNLLKEAIRSNIARSENVVMNVFRSLNGVCDWPAKLKTLNALMKLLTVNDQWFRNLKQAAGLVTVMIVTCNHYILDLPDPLTRDDTLRQSVINFLVWVIKTRKIECAGAGRDFILYMYRLSKFPEFSELKRELEEFPKNFGFASHEEVLWKPCGYIPFRMANEYTKKLDFMSSMNRPLDAHWEWFVHQHLRQPDAYSLRLESIRYLLYLVPKEVITFETKTSIIHAIMSAPNMTPEQQYFMKLYLWIDWIGYEAATEYRMIEVPFFLVRTALNLPEIQHERSKEMQNKGGVLPSSSGPPLANQLLDFISKAPTFFHPQLAKSINRSLNNAMALIRATCPPMVVSTVLEHHRIDRRVHEQMRAMWPDFIRAPNHVAHSTPPHLSPSTSAGFGAQTRRQKEVEIITLDDEGSTSKKKNSKSTDSKVFDGKTKNGKIIKRKGPAVKAKEYNAALDQLGEMLRAKTETLQSQWKDLTDDEERCDAVEMYLQYIYENDLEEEKQEAAAKCLLHIISPVIPEDSVVTSSTEKENFTHPIYLFFRTLCFPDTDDEVVGDTTMNMLIAMREIDPAISYLFLFFLKGNMEGQKQQKEKHCILMYREMAKSFYERVDEMVAKDLDLCAVNDLKLFQHMVLFVIGLFKEEISSSPLILESVCKAVDGEMIKEIIGGIVRDKVSIFRKDTFAPIFMASLEWNSKSQWMLWHLINAEAVSLEWFVNSIPKLDYKMHSEAVSNILLLLRRSDREPWSALFRSFFLRPAIESDLFTVDALKITIDDEDQLKKTANIVAGMIKKTISEGESKKESSKKGQPKLYIEQIVNHLAMFTEHCLGKGKKIADSFFAQNSMQDAFQEISQCSSAATFRAKFQNMFSYMDILNAEKEEAGGGTSGGGSTRTLRGNRDRTAKRKGEEDTGNRRKKSARYAESSSSDSD